MTLRVVTARVHSPVCKVEGLKRTTEDIVNQEVVAMGSIFSFVLGCVVLSHFRFVKKVITF